MQIVGYKKFYELVELEPPLEKKYLTWESQPITDTQKKALRKFGVGYTGCKTRGQASATLALLITRANKKLATPGQMLVLKSYGVEKVWSKDVFWTKQFLYAKAYRSKLPEYIAERIYG